MCSNVCANCDSEFPNRKKIDGKVRNLSSRKYCIECSPFGEHNTAQIECEEEVGLCDICGREYDYDREKGHRRTTCNSCLTLSRRRKRKKKLVKENGGCCKKCGYSKCLRALSFHHTSEKNFTIASKITEKTIEELQKEAENCELLCENCHREKHCQFCKR